MVNIGKRITDLRKSQGISTNKLANKAGVSQSYLRDIELNKKNPTVEILSYICYALNISLKDFFDIDQNEISPIALSILRNLNQNQQIKLAEFVAEILNEKSNG